MATYSSDEIGDEPKTRYHKKLKDADLDCCLYQIRSDVWKNDPTKWPDLEFPDIYVYLIETPGVLPGSLWKTERTLKHRTNSSVSGWKQFIIIRKLYLIYLIYLLILDSFQYYINLWYWKLRLYYLKDFMRTHICHELL